MGEDGTVDMDLMMVTFSMCYIACVVFLFLPV